MTTLKEAFDDGKYITSKANNNVLYVGYGINHMYYDFLARVMFARTDQGGVSVTPFSQLDSQTIGAMRERLIELEGKPPELFDPGTATVRPKFPPAVARKSP